MIKYNYDTYQEEIIRDLCELIAIPSVNNDNPKPDMPFGEDVERGFQWVKEKALEMGFEVTEFDGYALQIDIGSGQHVIGMLCHVDVVPGGDGWETDPFKAEIKDNLVYGRGTVDDKGPLVCCLYAAKFMRDNKLIPDDTRLRIVVGGDEEREWKDIAYYCKHAEAPEISFAADGKFPLVFGEKGLIDFDYLWHLTRSIETPIQLEKLSGGMARNSVPASADFVLRTENAEAVANEIKAEAEKMGYDAEVNTDNCFVNVHVKGIGCHAMVPERGINAVSRAMHLLSALGEKLDCHSFAASYEKYIADDYTGGLLGCACSDKESGALTFNPGKITLENNDVKILAGIRYPVSKKYETFATCIKAVAEKMNCECKIIDHMSPIYFKRDDEVVVLLEKAYRDVTGDDVNQPFTVGAATFARTMPNTVAFGPIFPEQEEMSHLPNEFISIEDLNKTTEIYINALHNLITR